MRHDYPGDMDRLSIDMTVVQDYAGTRRPRHADAIELFALAESGSVELIVAPQGHRDDVAPGPLAEGLAVLVAKGLIREADQLAVVSEHTVIPFTIGSGVEGFSEAWNEVIATWHTNESRPPGDKDRWHAETHVNEQADVLITDDKPLRVMCRRLNDEHGIPITAKGLTEYMTSRRAGAGS
jgi:hypothetical protein